ncbi:putative MFS family arabinose efflux permease [Stackebrandtia albiflava]|uniref:Putative MFS family arabinose efflux permease n=1 Tax=Stackebrandtia albiflava TaxID=406432 RepID=A0A562VB72_9ACTN|nr:MFS transporter [Stackebrandtia albiflava]TWJ15113.1 putative MFS family arabinose efflux permease [Stackebrandtia albiflava]
MTPTYPPPDVARIQTRTLTLLFVTQILGGVGVAVGIAVGALLLEDLTGTSALAGLGQSSAVIGGALLAIPIVRVTGARGRRHGLVLAYASGVVGALLVAGALYLRSAPLAFVGMFLLGGGTAANLQARYAAADLAAPARRARQLSIVVWATTIGAVTGPSLAPLADDTLREQLSGPRYAGPFLASAVGFALAAVLLWTFLRPDPLRIARSLTDTGEAAPRASVGQGWREFRRNRTARLGVLAVALGHLVMVAVMAMTPIHIKHGMTDPDQVTTVVGVVLSLHIAGMYALSPVAGLLADRWGQRPVILLGIALLVAACATAGTAGHDHTRLAVGLVLLGLGWSCTMVAGSAMLTGAVPTDRRPGLQGLSDLTMGIAGALAGALSGFVVELAGYPWLALLAAITVLPVTVLVWRARDTGKGGTS